MEKNKLTSQCSHQFSFNQRPLTLKINLNHGECRASSGKNGLEQSGTDMTEGRAVWSASLSWKKLSLMSVILIFRKLFETFLIYQNMKVALSNHVHKIVKIIITCNCVFLPCTHLNAQQSSSPRRANLNPCASFSGSHLQCWTHCPDCPSHSNARFQTI